LFVHIVKYFTFKTLNVNVEQYFFPVLSILSHTSYWFAVRDQGEMIAPFLNQSHSSYCS